MNLYGFVGNKSLNRIDYLGLNARTIPAGAPNCTVLLKHSHGPTTAENHWNSWSTSAETQITSAKFSIGEIPNVPFYGRCAVIGCGFRKPGDANFWITGVPDAYGGDPDQQNGLVGYDELGFSGRVAHNGGYGDTMDGYLKYIKSSWRSALREGRTLAEACAKDPCCLCTTIKVRFEVDANDATHAANGLSTHQCYQEQTYPTAYAQKNFQEIIPSSQVPLIQDPSALGIKLLPASGQTESFTVLRIK